MYAMIYGVLGVVLGVWRVRVFSRLLNRMYPLATERSLFQPSDVLVLFPWALTWPVLIVLDPLWNRQLWNDHLRRNQRWS